MKYFSLFFALLLFSVALPKTALADKQETLPVQILTQEGTLILEFSVSIENAGGGADIVATDLGTDGIPELLISNGMGNEPLVRIFRQDGSEIGSFLAYEKEKRMGIELAVCDLDQDGLQEIITAPGRGNEPIVHVFSNQGKEKFGQGMLVYAKTFLGGVHIACGDVDGDGNKEIITGAGSGGGPHVRIWNPESETWKLEKEFFAFSAEDRRGVLVNTTNSGELFVASAQGSPTDLLFYKNLTLFSKQSYEHLQNGLRDFSSEKSFTMLSLSQTKTLLETSLQKEIKTKSLFGDVRFDLFDLNKDEQNEIITISASPFFASSEEKHILVDLSAQRLFAYQNGRLENSFLVSTGLWNSTPIGEHTVLEKVPFVHYRWSYGEMDPRNYDLGLVPYNLRFYPHIYIHYAYWHNNFGYPMSHGCINVNLENMKWIYDWAQQGIKVKVIHNKNIS